MVKQADEYDIPIIEEILLDAVNWMAESGLQNQWNESNVKWSSLSKSYKINNFYIAYQNGLPTACMACVEEKTFFEKHDTALYVCNVKDTNPVLL